MAERDLHPKSRLLTSACHQALFCSLRVGLASDYETDFGLKNTIFFLAVWRRDTSSTSKPTATRGLPPSSDQGFCVRPSCGILQCWLASKRAFRPKSQTILEGERVFDSMWWPAAVQWKDSGAKSVAERDNEQVTWWAPGYRKVSHESQISSLVARHHQPVLSDGPELFCL